MDNFISCLNPAPALFGLAQDVLTAMLPQDVANIVAVPLVEALALFVLAAGILFFHNNL